MRIALAQINPLVGDFTGNLKLIKDCIEQLKSKTDIIIFPELCIPGYNPQDLALRPDFVRKCEEIIESLKNYSSHLGTYLILGSIRKEGDKILNSAYIIHEGLIKHIHDKIALPNYDVFDEKRLFSPGSKIEAVNILGKKIVILICEDIWEENIVETIAKINPEITLVLNASPYTKVKNEQRLQTSINYAKKTGSMVFYCNQVGIQDNLIFDGRSFALNCNGELIYQSKIFEEDLSIVEEDQKSINSEPEDKIANVYAGLFFSLKDYLRKNNLKKVVIGFSSGIDSSLSSILAMDAIGKENVYLVALPTKFNSSETHKDAAEFAKINNISIDEYVIQELYENALKTLNINNISHVTSQNLQSRIRGTLLMALSNQNNALLLSTGNKSELAVGYATIYGDMNGGYNLLKDIYKTEVYELAKWRNENIPKNSKHNLQSTIPVNIITKEPTAELSYGQKDSDSLPPYEMLDKILYNYIDLLNSKETIVNLGYKSEIVDHVLNLVRISEFKRYQSTLGPKISEMSFGSDWRMPITNKFY